jgi:hypothetical protein
MPEIKLSIIRDKDLCNKCDMKGKCGITMEGDFYISECGGFVKKEMDDHADST